MHTLLGYTYIVNDDTEDTYIYNNKTLYPTLNKTIESIREYIDQIDNIDYYEDFDQFVNEYEGKSFIPRLVAKVNGYCNITVECVYDKKE